MAHNLFQYFEIDPFFPKISFARTVLKAWAISEMEFGINISYLYNIKYMKVFLPIIVRWYNKIVPLLFLSVAILSLFKNSTGEKEEPECFYKLVTHMQ